MSRPKVLGHDVCYLYLFCKSFHCRSFDQLTAISCVNKGSHSFPYHPARYLPVESIRGIHPRWEMMHVTSLKFQVGGINTYEHLYFPKFFQGYIPRPPRKAERMGGYRRGKGCVMAVRGTDAPGMNHTCLHSPATEHHCTLTSTHLPSH